MRGVDDTRLLPMFPLGTVLFPRGVLPLRVFEARYLQMIEDCTAADGEFGVVLIERGAEVGGGDERTDLGTAARILQVAELDGGHLAVVAVGLRRIEVSSWLDDDPYPQALVRDLAEEPPGDVAARLTAAEQGLRKVLALHSELGVDVGDLSFRLAADPVTASYQACALAPLGSFDAQRLLRHGDAGSRLDALNVLLADQAELLELRLRS